MEGNADDASGNGHHGVLHGGTPAHDAQGLAGGAITFDGEDDHALIPDDPAFELESFTRSVVLKAPPTGVRNWVLSRGTLFGNYSVTIHPLDHFSPSSPSYVHAIPEVGNFSCRMSTEPVVPDTFVALAVVIDATGDGVRATTYANGRLVYSFPSAHLPDTEPAPLYLGAGGYYDPLTDFFTGTLDDVRIYDRPLTADEIRAIHCR